MPTILKPPTDRKPDGRYHPGEGDHGSGRRPPHPPTEKRTGGNGDGDGDDYNDRPRGRRGPRDRLAQARIGLFCALACDLMFFVVIVVVFLITKVNVHFDPYGHQVNNWLPTVIPKILILNTVVLLLSSVTAEIARRSMFREADVMDEWIGLGRPTSRRATLWLSITLILGAAFLAGQWTAWKQIAAQHIFRIHQASSRFFYLITIAHAVHLFLGVAALVLALTILQRSRLMATRQVWVDATVWYWHAMGALWIFLFLLLEFGQ